MNRARLEQSEELLRLQEDLMARQVKAQQDGNRALVVALQEQICSLQEAQGVHPRHQSCGL